MIIAMIAIPAMAPPTLPMMAPVLIPLLAVTSVELALAVVLPVSVDDNRVVCCV
jgi:hypothetical protein